MDPYDPYEPEDQINVGVELAELSWRAGYGSALVDLERQSSSDARGDAIIEASRRISGAGMFGDPYESTEPEFFDE
jgi:hypothetical protein